MLLRDQITLENAFVRLEPLSLAHTDELAEATAGLEHAWYTSVPTPDGVAAEIEQRLTWHDLGRNLLELQSFASDCARLLYHFVFLS